MTEFRIATARRHRSAQGGRRAQMGGARDGGALSQDDQRSACATSTAYNARMKRAPSKGEELHPHRPDRLRPRRRRSRCSRRRRWTLARCPVYRRHHPRNGRPDDGRRQGHRRRCQAPCADGARRRHPRAGDSDPALLGRRHHRHHQGELPTVSPSRCTSKIDSRTILGEQGAEQLLGNGDMLYMAGGGRIPALHGPRSSRMARSRRSSRTLNRRAPDYLEFITADEFDEDGAMAGGKGGGDEYGGSGDGVYDKAVHGAHRQEGSTLLCSVGSPSATTRPRH